MDATMIQLVNDLEVALLKAEEALEKAKRVSSIAADFFDYRDSKKWRLSDVQNVRSMMPDAARDHDIVHDYLVDSGRAVSTAAVRLEQIRAGLLAGDATKP